MQLWAHRGGGKGPLENTMQGFTLALDAGFQAIEFDVMLSRDDVLYVHHDFTLGRIAKAPSSGAIDEFALINSLDSAHLDNCFAAGQPVLRFDTLAHWLFAHGLEANVELKAQTPAAARRLGKAMQRWVSAQSQAFQAYAKNHWVYSSFYHATLLPLQGLRIAILYEQLDPNWILRADALQAEAVHLHYSGVTASQTYRIHTSKRKVRVYTVNTREEVARLQQIGVDAVFTDNLALLTR